MTRLALCLRARLDKEAAEIQAAATQAAAAAADDGDTSNGSEIERPGEAGGGGGGEEGGDSTDEAQGGEGDQPWIDQPHRCRLRPKQPPSPLLRAQPAAGPTSHGIPEYTAAASLPEPLDSSSTGRKSRGASTGPSGPGSGGGGGGRLGSLRQISVDSGEPGSGNPG